MSPAPRCSGGCAATRRSRPSRCSSWDTTARATERHTVGSIAVDLARHEVRADGRLVRMTALEIKVLAFLASDPGRVRSRTELLDEVWGTEWERDERAVDTTIKRVRRKLGA